MSVQQGDVVRLKTEGVGIIIGEFVDYNDGSERWIVQLLHGGTRQWAKENCERAPSNE